MKLNSRPQSDQDLLFLPAYQQAALIRRGELSPRELVDLHLAQIAALDPHFLAYEEVYEREARQAADLAAIQAAEGRLLGPLHGVTVAVKDLFDLAGHVTTAGSRSRMNAVAAGTASAIEQLTASGIIVLGKVKTVEFAYGSWGTNALMGTPRNPWSREKQLVPGGSSSGSAVAIAAGLASVALGSDTGGSVRIPASMCGIVGLKTTAGRISTRGVVPLSRTLDTVGPLVRSVEDAALMFSILAESRAASPGSAGPDLNAVLAALGAPIAGARLAVPAGSLHGEVTPDVATSFGAALQIFRSLNAEIIEVKLPGSFFACVDAMTRIISAEGYGEHGAWIEAHSDIDPFVRKRLALGKTINRQDYLKVLELRKEATAEFCRLLAGFDALLTPTTVMPAIPIEAVDENVSPLNRLTRPANYFGLCALAVPSGFTPAGLPLSLQIIGNPDDEIRILRLGAAFQRKAGLGARHPTLPVR